MKPLHQFLWRLDIDRATFFALALRAWQFLAGPVTAILIGTFFSPDMQGYYYTFASLLAMQSFLELGFHVVILNVASHEWAWLNLDPEGRIRGDTDSLSRLVSLGRLIAKWYAAVAILFIVIVGCVGTIFFLDGSLALGNWLPPWAVLVVLTSVSLWALPFHALLEGCNQVATVQRFRLWQAVTGTMVVWACVPLGAGLWTCVAIAMVKVIWEGLLLGRQFRRFFAPFLRKPAGPRIDWRTSLWPMQWRLAIQGFFNYFANWIFTPVMFKISPAAGGQMGMSWTVLMALQAAALAWVQTRAPKFGVLAARRDYQELDRIFRRLVLVSSAALAAGCATFLGAIAVLNHFQIPLADRFLPWDSLCLFTLGIVLYHIPHCQSFYVRAHKREMFLLAGVVSSSAIGLLTIVLGARFGAIGVASGYLAVVVLFVFPYQMKLWQQCRAERDNSPLAVNDEQNQGAAEAT